jgi:hypothetical protein
LLASSDAVVLARSRSRWRRTISGPDVGLQLQKLSSREFALGISFVQNCCGVTARGAIKLAMRAIGIAPISEAGKYQEKEAHPQNPAPGEVGCTRVEIRHLASFHWWSATNPTQALGVRRGSLKVALVRPCNERRNILRKARRRLLWLPSWHAYFPILQPPRWICNVRKSSESSPGGFDLDGY